MFANVSSDAIKNGRNKYCFFMLALPLVSRDIWPRFFQSWGKFPSRDFVIGKRQSRNSWINPGIGS